MGRVEGTYNDSEFLIGNPNFFPTNTGLLYFWYRREMINRLCLLDAIKWLERSNLLAWNQTLLFDHSLKRVDFNGHVWDSVGFTYLYGHYETRYEQNEQIKSPSIVVIESIFHRHTFLEDIEGFITRIEMQSARMKNYSTGSRIFPILFYISISKKAFELAKSKGLLLYNVNDWLGSFSSDLIDFLVNPFSKNYNTLEKCNNFIASLETQGQKGNFILQDLLKIKYSLPYVQKGWKWRRHLHYQLQDEKYYIDWIMFDPEGNPSMCFFINKDSLSAENEEMISEELNRLKYIYDELGLNPDSIKTIVFDRKGQI